jgi:hypothetical protein
MRGVCSAIVFDMCGLQGSDGLMRRFGREREIERAKLCLRDTV